MIPYTCLLEFEFILDSYLYKLDVNFSSSLTLLELSQNCFYNFRRVDCILNGCIIGVTLLSMVKIARRVVQLRLNFVKVTIL